MPYTNGPGGSGQYTKKIYHIGSHIPGWLKSFLPKTALRVEEEAWNAYPYTKTRTTCPFVDKFYIDVETYYHSDAGLLVSFCITTSLFLEQLWKKCICLLGSQLIDWCFELGL